MYNCTYIHIQYTISSEIGIKIIIIVCTIISLQFIHFLLSMLKLPVTIRLNVLLQIFFHCRIIDEQSIKSNYHDETTDLIHLSLDDMASVICDWGSQR